MTHPRLIAQLNSLERRTGRGGRDSIDHRPGAHDDVINAAAGALVTAQAAGRSRLSRMANHRRYTRLTNRSSKTLRNHKAAVSL